MLFLSSQLSHPDSIKTEKNVTVLSKSLNVSGQLNDSLLCPMHPDANFPPRAQVTTAKARAGPGQNPRKRAITSALGDCWGAGGLSPGSPPHLYRQHLER